jgi:hypothetical protein
MPTLLIGFCGLAEIDVTFFSGSEKDSPQSFHFCQATGMVARRFTFKPKIPICVIFQCLRLENIDICYGQL